MSNVRTTEEYITLDDEWKGSMLRMLRDEKSTSKRKISMNLQQINMDLFKISVPRFSAVQIQTEITFVLITLLHLFFSKLLRILFR